MKLLITAGGTREPIDGVRFISNVSTGATGLMLADQFARRGHEVTMLLSSGATARPSMALLKRLHRIERFDSFGDLNDRMRLLLHRNAYDAVLHLAAVSDYSVSAIRVGGRTMKSGVVGKIDSEHEVVLHLRRNFKIVNRLKSYSGNKEVVVVAFKLTNTISPARQRKAVKKLSRSGDVDFVLHNDLHDIDAAEGVHRATLYRAGQPLWAASTKREIARKLETTLKEIA